MGKKTALILFVIALTFLGIYYFLQPKSQLQNRPKDYTFDYSEGNCKIDNDCEWAGEGCGGGHGICTNMPAKYEGAITTCDINENFPINKGYTCGCIMNRCGWKQ